MIHFSKFSYLSSFYKIKLTLVLLAIISSVAFLELLIGILQTDHDPLSECRQDDNRLHHIMKPNSQCQSETAEWDISYKINSIGLRDEEILAKEKEEFRILVLGDSFVEGIGVDEANRFTELIESKLSKHYDRNINVINAGISSYSPILELELLKNKFETIQPNLIMVGLDMTDFKDEIGYWNFLTEKTDEKNYPNEEKTKYIGVASNLNQEQAQIQNFKKETSWQKNDNLEPFLKIKMVLRKSKLYVLLTNEIKNFLNKPYLADGSPPIIEGDIETDLFAIARDNLNQDVYKILWQLPKESLIGFKQISEQKGAELIFFTYPHGMQVDGKQWGRGRLTRGFVRGKTYSAKTLEDFVKIGEELNVPTLNLLGSFRENSNKKLYFDWDGHFTEESHMVIADAIIEFIIDKQLVY